MSYLYSYSCLFPPLHPVLMRQYIFKYETVRKLCYILKADTVIERGKRGQFNHLPTVALNKGQRYFYHRKRRGGQEPAEGYPHTAVIYRLRAVLREGGKTTPKWLKQLSLTGRGSSGVRSDDIRQPFCFFSNRDKCLFAHFSNAERILMLRWQKALSASTQPGCAADGCHGDTALAVPFSETAAILT